MSLAVLLQAAEYIERKEREKEHGYASTLPMPSEYLSTSPVRTTTTSYSSNKSSTRRTRNKNKVTNNRTIHNELEKNRRAHLRNCLEKLKEMVPRGPDGSRHTTLGLLTKAKHFIKNLEERDRRQTDQKENLQREQRHMRRKLNSLSSDLDLSPSSEDFLLEDYGSSDSTYGSLEENKLEDPQAKGFAGMRRCDLESNYGLKRRSVSESSGFSTESNSSSGSSLSESDEIDILGGGVSPAQEADDSDEVSSNRSSLSLSSDGSVVISTRRLTLKEEINHARNLSL